MNLTCASILGLGLVALIQAPSGSKAAPAPHDVCWSKGLGRVEVHKLSERRLRLELDGSTGTTSRELDLATLPEGQRVTDLRASGLLDTGLVIAMTIEEGTQRSYRFALARELAPAKEVESVGSTSAGLTSWWISEPIFSDPGEPYRIVDVHNPGGDSIEITFRRGYVELDRPAEARIDELVFVDNCPMSARAIQPGRASLLHVTESAR